VPFCSHPERARSATRGPYQYIREPFWHIFRDVHKPRRRFSFLRETGNGKRETRKVFATAPYPSHPELACAE
jgi:hypothetical protein